MGAGLPSSQVVRTENANGQGRVLILCEHASNRFPALFGDLGLDPATRQSHAAWDPGALPVARALARRLDAPLIRACVSRLVYDLNRPPHAPGAMVTRSEIHEVPGNRALSDEDRLARVRAVYLPFHNRVRHEIAARLATGRLDALITMHSFTPVWHGQPRQVEIGVIHDADDRMARAVHARLAAETGLDVRLNDPYSAADGVTHSLALHATPMGLPHVMLEIRNDLIADPAAQRAMADRLAPAILAATEDVTCPIG